MAQSAQIAATRVVLVPLRLSLYLAACVQYLLASLGKLHSPWNICKIGAVYWLPVIVIDIFLGSKVEHLSQTTLVGLGAEDAGALKGNHLHFWLVREMFLYTRPSNKYSYLPAEAHAVYSSWDELYIPIDTTIAVIRSTSLSSSSPLL